MAGQLRDRKPETEAPRQGTSTNPHLTAQTLQFHIFEDVDLKAPIDTILDMKATLKPSKMHSLGNMDNDGADKRICPSKQTASNKCKASPETSSRTKKAPTNDHEDAADWMTEEDAWFLLETILCGKICRPTPFAEIAQDCPAVWKRALQVFEGNKEAARKWLETRSSLFDGRRAISVAMQIGGRRKVLQELKRLSESKL